MCLGNGLGFTFDDGVSDEDLFGYRYGAFVLELTEDLPIGLTLGYTNENGVLSRGGEQAELVELLKIYEGKLEPVYPCNIEMPAENVPVFSYVSEKEPPRR